MTLPLSLSGLWKTLRDSGPRGRMLRGVLANVYDKGAVTLVQLIAIPVLTKAWGADGYGLWLMLLTVPTYIALSDLGLGTAAGVALTQCVASCDYDRAVRVIQSTIAFIISTVSLVAFIALGYAAWILNTGRTVGPFGAFDIAFAIVLITGYAIVFTQMSVVTIVYRATHKFDLAMAFAGTWILLEGAGLVIVALSGFGIVAAAGSYFVLRILGYLLFVNLLRRKEPWAKIGVRRAEKTLIRTLAKPSAAALALTFATAAMLQGTVLALGATAGAATVAVFAASRTLSRAPLQLSGMFVRPSIPELTRAITEGNHALERRLNLLNMLAAALATVPFGMALVIWGEDLLGWISHNKLAGSTSVMALLALAASLNALWTARAAPLIAMNRQGDFAFLYLGLAALSVLVVALSSDNQALNAAAAAAAAELLLACWIFIRNPGTWKKSL